MFGLQKIGGVAAVVVAIIIGLARTILGPGSFLWTLARPGTGHAAAPPGPA